MNFIIIVNFLIAATCAVSRSEFCDGCKLTVYAYIELMADELEQLYKLPNRNNLTIDPDPIMDYLCEDVFFRGYKGYVTSSCRMIRENYRDKFLDEFTGHVSLAMFASASETIQHQVRDILVLFVVLTDLISFVFVLDLCLEHRCL